MIPCGLDALDGFIAPAFLRPEIVTTGAVIANAVCDPPGVRLVRLTMTPQPMRGATNTSTVE